MSEPIRVTTIKPVDVHDVQDQGCKAIILLAASLGWSAAKSPGPMHLVSPDDGMLVRVPTNTSIRMSLWRSCLNSVLRHSTSHVPTLELVEAIAKATKMSKSHLSRMSSLVANGAPPETEPSIELGVEPPPPEVAVDLEAAELEPAKKEAYVVRLGAKVGGGARNYVSPNVEVWTWADGTQSLHCKFCGLQFSTAVGVANHASQRHRGQTQEGFLEPGRMTPTVMAPTPYKPREEKEEPVPEPEPEMVVLPPLPDPDEPKPDDWDVEEVDLLQQIIDVLWPSVSEKVRAAHAERDQAIEERDAAIARAEKAETYIQTLRELLNE